jgi:hypothetical protein
MTLSRIIRCVKGVHLSLIRVDRLTKTFVIGDYLSLMVQKNASSLTPRPNLARIGEEIVVAGLFIQLVLPPDCFLGLERRVPSRADLEIS